VPDEATSALDVETESRVQEAIKRLSRGGTTFIIAHRLSTVAYADRILVIKGGTIVESGSHSDLCRQGGYYANLIRKQKNGLLAEAA